ncbi:alpha/beta fold hydrolase [Roseobacter sinensis]|uniref:Alpha/beta hydrolase n=1 Tax=Roseobacter sinensis TaxID=2931391 RepID=A0ABT3BF48_9RHOB|nr:alpha/beta hydrolase [Roseobacter sp. WL0113]MCV3271754.1 alpha/beta hydrolase [Roseobacter sp. WL0113]
MIDWSVTPETRLAVGGVSLEYACHGPPPGQGPTFVLLHEGLGSVALWRDVPAALAARTGLGVFAYSRHGYGRSDPARLPRPLDYMTREAKAVLGPLMDAAGLGDVILLGHSDGATIVGEYAGSVSDQRVRGLVLIAPHFFVEPKGIAAIRAAGTAFASGDLRARLAPYHDDVDGAFRGWHDAWTDPSFAEWNVADVIEYWRIPALVVQGTEDAYGSLAQVDEIAARAYSPVETLILEGCGHTPHLEQTEATLEAVQDFAARLLRLERAHVALA